MASGMTVVNRRIAETEEGISEEALWGIDQMLILDLYVERSAWQAHIKGFFAYIESRGGVELLLEDPEPPMFMLNHVLR